jgi:hypothetical protein
MEDCAHLHIWSSSAGKLRGTDIAIALAANANGIQILDQQKDKDLQDTVVIDIL